MSAAVDSLLFDRFSQPVTNRTVARRGAMEIGESEFRSRICAWRAAFETIKNPAIALYETDGVEFSAALIGAWYAGKSVFLPGDAQTETCRALTARNCAFAGAFPEGVDRVQARETLAATTPLQALNSEEVHLILFTSGSTGAPQAIPKRLSQLLAEVHTLENVFGAKIGDGDMVATVSHQHIYGLLFKILWPLVYHRPFVAESVVYPEQLLSVLAAGKCAIVSGPAHLKRLPETLNWQAVRHNITATFSSGGPLPLSAASTVELLLGHAPIEVYGSSETGGVAFRQCGHGIVAPWTPLPGVDVSTQDGQLTVRSAHLADREWFHVPDNITLDEQGNFTLLGRADRIAKIEGKRVSLVGVEEALIKTGFVSDVRVVPLASSRDELGAVVVPSSAGWDVLRAENTRGLRARLDAALAGSVERLAHPRRWRWVDSLPLNGTGKTSHAATLELFADYGVARPAVHVLQTSPHDASIELYVSPHLAVFDGHFRNLPVLAGVVQVDWAMLLGRTQFGITLPFARMEAVKFMRVYQPGPLLSLNLQWNAERRLLTFRFESAGNTHSNGRIFFDA